MPTGSSYEQDELPPPGSRWGAGARSVLPYLSKVLQSRPASGPEMREPKAHDGKAQEGSNQPTAA